jgi:hypothetical protein
MERIGVEISPHEKSGRLPHGLFSQERDQNLLDGRKANERCTMGVCTFRRDDHHHIRRLVACIVKA